MACAFSCAPNTGAFADDCYYPGDPGCFDDDRRLPRPGRIAARAALDMVGLPYSWGGGGAGGPGYGIGRGAKIWGFDCSGLTQFAWATAGVTISRTAQSQWRDGARISRAEVRAGDLIFFDSNRGRPGPEHVGIAINRKRMVNAPFTGARVRVERLDRRDYLGAVRPSADPDR